MRVRISVLHGLGKIGTRLVSSSGYVFYSLSLPEGLSAKTFVINKKCRDYWLSFCDLCNQLFVLCFQIDFLAIDEKVDDNKTLV